LTSQRVRLALLLRDHPPGAGHRCLVGRIVAGDRDDLDGAEGGPQPPEGRELVIVDLGHATMMPGSAW
jgi:hypothetical protein